MPKFTRYGPVVPDALVQALEDDKVVIFCGAGISMGAGLPDFNGLVKHCYAELNADPPKSKRSEWTWPDRLLGALEMQCSASDVRRVVASRLSEAPKTLDLHKAILRLARLTRTRGIRLVTTNFDTYFEQAQDDLLFGRHLHSGPVLPIPRNDRIASWRSVVYLHGRLADDGENDHLVLTSADFGRAYLTEAWAARFVTRLFAEFTVLFIGYSLNDPVLRYMTDAIAADRRLAVGNDQASAYIFVGHRGPAEPEKRLFRDRGLEPIFYNQERHHLRLKQTLMAWAQAREDFFLSAKTIVEHAAGSRPQALDPSEADNLLWAVLDRPNDGGHGARIFAGLETAPPIEWLIEFERREATLLNDWVRVEQEARKADKPVPPERILHLRQLTPPGETEPFFVTQTSDALIRWLVRHLDTIELVEWIIDKLDAGRHLHARLRRAIRERLASQQSLAPGFKLFWRIVAAEGVGHLVGFAGERRRLELLTSLHQRASIRHNLVHYLGA
jgi:SIR2-like domain